MPSLTGVDKLQDRVEFLTEAQHADLQSRMVALAARLDEVEEKVTTTVTSTVKAENVELVRMLRQQGDSADEVAEVLGRTLARLGAEVETLAKAVERLEARLDATDRPDVEDRPE